MATKQKPSKLTIKDLIPDPANANKGTQRGDGALRTSIQQLGLGRSIVTDKNNVVIAGNKTWEKAAEVGITKLRVVETSGDELVVVKRTDLDLSRDPRARKLAVADNRIGQVNLDFDPAALQAIRDDIGLPMDDIGLTDTELALMHKATAEAEAAAETQPGEVHIPESFQVLVDCKDESQQRALFERMTAEGYTCKVLTM
jgi:hypothetical protein